MKLFAVFIVLVLLGLVSSLPNSVHAQSPKDADSWDWPLKPWDKFTVGHSSNGGFGFGQWVGSTRHGGIDVWERPDKSAKETVYAAANGIVSYVCQSPGSKKHCRGFGYPNDVNTGRLYRAVLISHRLPDGTHVTSVYGHLNPDTPQVKVGDSVEKGKIIGYLAPTGDCGERCDVAHLHFGIRRGWYGESAFPGGGWGYVAQSEEKSEFPMWI